MTELEERSTPCVEILQNRTFSSTLTHTALCLQMDLIALVLDAKTIVIHRFNWQRLAMISPCESSNEKINAISWSPDGVLLAVGMDNGRLALHAVDSASRQASKDASTSLASRKLVSAPTALHWAMFRADKTASREAMLWERAYAERDTPSWQPSGTKKQGKRARAVLVVGDQDGCIYLLGFDLRFTIAKTRVMPTGIPVTRVHVASNAKLIVALGERNGTVLARAVPLDQLFSSRAELFRVGAEVVALSDAREKLHECISRMCNRWSSSVDSALKRAVERPLNDSLATVGEDVERYGAWHILRDGHQSTTLHSALAICLASEVGEGGAREALRTFRGGADDVDEAILTAIAVAETLLFRASEYRGLIGVSSKFEHVGVCSDGAERALQSASSLFSELSAFLLKFYEVCAEIESFLVWLGIEALKADKEDPDDATGVPVLSHEEQELVGKFFSRHLADIESGSVDILSRTLRTKVLPSVEKLHASAQKLVVTPFQAMSATLGVNFGMEIALSSMNETLAHVSIAERMLDEAIVELCFPDGKGKVVTARFLSKQQQWYGNCVQVKESPQVIVDWSHFRGEHFFVFSVGECSSSSDAITLSLQFKLCKAQVLERSKFVKLSAADDGKLFKGMTATYIDDRDMKLLGEITVTSNTKRCTLSAYSGNTR